jgi:hypothetical protein
MFFWSASQCAEWANRIGYGSDALERRTRSDYKSDSSIVAFYGPPRPANVAVARKLASFLGPFKSCLLWIKEFGIWPSSENLHLYYRLRQSYGDYSELRAAPGHFFLGHELTDLVSYMDLAVQFGWGAHLLTAENWTYLWLSHDEWCLIESENQRKDIESELDAFSMRHMPTSSRSVEPG